MLAVHTPITGEVIAEVEPTAPDAVDSVLARASEAQRAWARRPASDRGAILVEAGRLLAAHAAELGELEARNTGRTPAEGRREADRAAQAFSYYGGWADKAAGTTIPVSSDVLAYTVREPYGVVVGVTPWNVPVRMAAKKAAQSVAFGNACVLKPAPETPLTAMRMAELLRAAGLPEGLVQVANGGPELGQALIEHPSTALVTFTGSPEGGRAVATAAAQRLIPAVLELGGKSPQLVFADADLDSALEGVLLGVFASAGQMCIAGSRLYVQRGIYDTFVERLRARVESIVVGDPSAPDVRVGPQMTAAQRDRTRAAIDRATAQGARMLATAQLPSDERLRGGFFVPPTLFADADPRSDLMRAEIFGPVLAVAPFEDEADAAAKAHDTEFGLAAGVWTSDGARAHRLARDLRAGTVWLNTYRALSDQVPFGGFGASGYGRENGEEAHRTYTQVKSVVSALDGPTPGYTL
ncbi:aldehyde dehydrogenase (NAD+) [Lipingzhangella halophila]|uniref:Aldehyde dehydrogenase (NAD+) n=1 Tax=Lipingzhangella halophila TaxID=1783352 RepID=A0A7W7RN17_9ACTN|nr:aldehyde dehydrogenase family protein [Lipingzhangella halophila]MBB4934971.1 aldehyde dehydrogenase (NAD+) [Lipingzhangella halophila]